MSISSKIVNGRKLITSCTLANCCLTFEKIDSQYLRLSNEKGESLTCTYDEFREIIQYFNNEIANETESLDQNKL